MKSKYIILLFITAVLILVAAMIISITEENIPANLELSTLEYKVNSTFTVYFTEKPAIAMFPNGSLVKGTYHHLMIYYWNSSVSKYAFYHDCNIVVDGTTYFDTIPIFYTISHDTIALTIDTIKTTVKFACNRDYCYYTGKSLNIIITKNDGKIDHLMEYVPDMLTSA